jgi:START domain
MTSDTGWRKRTQKKGIQIWQQPFTDDKNDLFRWRIPRVAASHRDVSEVFVHQMTDYHQYWTAEYTGGFVVEELTDNAQIIYQQFKPNVPFISKRDLLYLQWSRQIDEKTSQTSFRSLQLDTLPVTSGFERIDWWGGHLFEANSDGSSQLVLIDRENQGGRFPAFVMNNVMPGYLFHQVESIIAFFEKGGTHAHEKLPESTNTALTIRNAYLTREKPLP